MPEHHFTTPRVVYLGLAYGEKDARRSASASSTRRPANRAARAQTANRRANGTPPSTLR